MASSKIIQVPHSPGGQNVDAFTVKLAPGKWEVISTEPNSDPDGLMIIMVRRVREEDFDAAKG